MYTGTGVNQSQTYRWYLLLYSPAGAYLKPVGCVFFCTRLQVLISNLWVVSSVLACRCLSQTCGLCLLLYSPAGAIYIVCS